MGVMQTGIACIGDGEKFADDDCIAKRDAFAGCVGLVTPEAVNSLEDDDIPGYYAYLAASDVYSSAATLMTVMGRRLRR